MAPDELETPEERAERQDRQFRSRRVTEHPRECSCEACLAGPRRPNALIVPYVEIPDHGKKN